MENVVPAVQKSSEKTLKELSPKEFQQMLSSWFQEKGLVQDMKSYLKFQMINVLKNTAVGKNIRQSASQTYTLAQQALHLIVAEYLLCHQCHFALSLFSTEVNLSNTFLPETKLFLDIENAPSSKMDKDNLVNILELIGIPKENQYFSQIIHKYFNKSSSSLLSCLLGFFVEVEYNMEKLNIDDEDDFMKNTILVLQSSKLPYKTQTQLLNNLKVCYDLKTKSYESQVLSLINKFEKELNYRAQKLHHCQKRKRCLEKKVLKLREENQMLQKKIQEDKPIYNKNIECSLEHCTEECTNAKKTCESYKKQIDKLQDLNAKQKGDIDRLKDDCTELLREFTSCQTKINVVNNKMREDVKSEIQVNGSEVDNITLSSDSITEELLKEAREKLRLLEEESEELDIRFNKFVIK